MARHCGISPISVGVTSLLGGRSEQPRVALSACPAAEIDPRSPLQAGVVWLWHERCSMEGMSHATRTAASGSAAILHNDALVIDAVIRSADDSYGRGSVRTHAGAGVLEPTPATPTVEAIVMQPTTARVTELERATNDRTVTTLLEVVNSVSEFASNDEEVVAVIHHLFESGRMKLVGQFTERDFTLA